MKLGDLVKLHSSSRRCGKLAGKIGLIVGFDSFGKASINVDGIIKNFHYTQITEVINEQSNS